VRPAERRPDGEMDLPPIVITVVWGYFGRPARAWTGAFLLWPAGGGGSPPSGRARPGPPRRRLVCCKRAAGDCSAGFCSVRLGGRSLVAPAARHRLGPNRQRASWPAPSAGRPTRAADRVGRRRAPRSECHAGTRCSVAGPIGGLAKPEPKPPLQPLSRPALTRPTNMNLNRL
jgi:hypothetical protein